MSWQCVSITGTLLPSEIGVLPSEIGIAFFSRPSSFSFSFVSQDSGGWIGLELIQMLEEALKVSLFVDRVEQLISI